MLANKIIDDDISKMKDENKQCNYCFIKNILKSYLFITKPIEKDILINHKFLIL